MHYFSIEEAESLISKLCEIIDRVRQLKLQAQRKIEEFHRLETDPKADSVSVALCRSQAEFLVSQINEVLEGILKLGCVPKGLDPYLVDFPFLLEGREVNLCWKYPEKHIAYYHGLEEGYSKRKMLPTSVLRRPVED